MSWATAEHIQGIQAFRATNVSCPLVVNAIFLNIRSEKDGLPFYLEHQQAIIRDDGTTGYLSSMPIIGVPEAYAGRICGPHTGIVNLTEASGDGAPLIPEVFKDDDGKWHMRIDGKTIGEIRWEDRVEKLLEFSGIREASGGVHL